MGSESANSELAKRVLPLSQIGDPVWALAELFPSQGSWDEEDYFTLPTNRLVEYADHSIEVLPWPTTNHQLISGMLSSALYAFLKAQMPKATVLFAPLPIRLWANKYREPDIMVMLDDHRSRRHQHFWDAPDLVMEVVALDNCQLDIETKRHEYARAGIPEYWIVDPEAETITVLTLQDDHYIEYGVFKSTEIARSKLLAGFEVNVDAVWAAAKH